MAKIVDTDYTGKFNLPIAIGRLNPIPADATEVWKTLAEAQNYAKNSPIAWVGQVIYVEETSKHYKISNVEGDLVEFGSGGQGSDLTWGQLGAGN